MKTDLYNKGGEKIGNVEVSDRLFGAPWNADLVHQALRVQETNRRERIAHAKDRGEVRGGGRKPWRQKGTGRARHGSIRSPLWVGGGRAHGPNKEKIYSLHISQKMRQGAMFAIFSKRLAEGEIKVVDSLGITEPKTKLLRDALKVLSPRQNALIIVSPENKAIFAASGNIEKVKVTDPRALNVYDLLRYKNVIIEQGALETIEQHYGSKK
ncbi:MAG: 50S ribosomal protein L4 [Parcubacteria group bacterium GW2011_GWA2_46_10]|nr:MAG: 50S ribosomal protein L4 [Parcubacteria group bacterium GW2011_GWA2_46_10]